MYVSYTIIYRTYRKSEHEVYHENCKGIALEQLLIRMS